MDWITVFTLILAILAAIQARIYWQMLQATRAIERPWVGAEPRGDFDAFDVSTPLEALLAQHLDMGAILEFVLVNYGKSPARIIGRTARLAILPHPLSPFPVDLPPTDTAVILLPPGKST